MRTNFLTAVAATVFLFVSCNFTGRKAVSGNAETDINPNTAKTKNSMETSISKKTIQLTRADFLQKVANIDESPKEWKYLGDKPCVIDFYADWCGPCKVLSPVLEELAKEYDGDIYVYKIDTEAEQQLSAEFGIRSIPSLLFCPLNEDPQMAQGAIPKDALKKIINEVLLKK